MDDIMQKLRNGQAATKDELTDLIERGETLKEELFQLAREQRERYYGDKVYLRALIEFSNICRQDCLYCGIRASNRHAVRYRLSKDEILHACERAYRTGYRTFVLQSGEDAYYTDDHLTDILSEIRSRFADCALTLSIGERSRESYARLFEAGANRFLMRHETATPDLYRRLHPTMAFESRRASLQALKEIGYQVGAGCMVGLPGQTPADLADDLLYLRDLQPDMIGIGPFIPHRDTPLHAERGGTLEQSLLMVALARILVPRSLMPATTAMGTIHQAGREMALRAGANVMMPIFTPLDHKKHYELYENKICMGEDGEECTGCISMRIAMTGYTADWGRGDHVRIRKASEAAQG